MDRDALAHHCMNAIAATIAEDPDQALEHLDAIGNSGDPFDMYAACCGFADIAARALTNLNGSAPDLAAGDMWIIEELEPGAASADPVKAFSVRFITTYANNDKETAPALYRAALEAGPRHFTESVCALLADAAAIHKLAMHRKDPS